jgi:mono/diheme cytochrome c family protein
VEAVISYLKTLSSRWRHSENYGDPTSLPPEPDWLYDQAGSKSHIESGASLFQSNCAGCHGSASTELLDLWGEPCPAPALETAVLKCGGEPMDLFRILSTGMDGTPMPSFREGLSEDERWDVVVFLKETRSAKRREMEAVGGK